MKKLKGVVDEPVVLRSGRRRRPGAQEFWLGDKSFSFFMAADVEGEKSGCAVARMGLVASWVWSPAVH